MVKRILLIALFLFVPLFANADDAAIVYGANFDEKNIHLDLDRMDYALEQAFGKEGNFSDVKDSFYAEFSSVVNNSPFFSERDLFEACLKAVNNKENCEKLLVNYMEVITYPRKMLFVY